MDIKTVFLNKEIEEFINMGERKNFKSKDSKHVLCKLNKSIYGLK